MTSGHYTAYCHNEEKGSWLHFNDSRFVSVCNVINCTRVDFVSAQEVEEQQPYMLFYRRIDNGKEESTEANTEKECEEDDDSTEEFEIEVKQAEDNSAMQEEKHDESVAEKVKKDQDESEVEEKKAPATKRRRISCVMLPKKRRGRGRGTVRESRSTKLASEESKEGSEDTSGVMESESEDKSDVIISESEDKSGAIDCESEENSPNAKEEVTPAKRETRGLVKGSNRYVKQEKPPSSDDSEKSSDESEETKGKTPARYRQFQEIERKAEEEARKELEKQRSGEAVPMAQRRPKRGERK